MLKNRAENSRNYNEYDRKPSLLIGGVLERIDLQGQPLNLDLTLTCGQAFRWRKSENGVWRGVVCDKLMELIVEDDHLLWRTYPSNGEALVRDYLRLADDVNAIYAALSVDDPHLAKLIKEYHGIRLLRQDPSETLLSFVCSAANSIPRIMAAIEALSQKFGDLICEVDGSCYYAFPRVEVLANADRIALEQTAVLAFRGANLKSVAQQILDKGEGWLMSLRGASYSETRNELISLRGIGSKIADCVCLFALDKDESVPVDTHVKQLAERLFLPQMKAKSITDGVYKLICEEFIRRYGKYAGWAQQFLYYEDLLRTRALGRGLQ